MGEWVWPAYVGIFGGLFVFALFLVPILGYQYRQYGRFTWRRLLGASGVSVYLVALVAYTLLPLPDSRGDWCSFGAPGWQTDPFRFLSDIADETAGLTLTATLRSTVVLQVVFNVFLFIPFGIILRRFLSRSLVTTVFCGFAVSLAIEMTQYTGIWGLYDCAYRVADVDDLITNTLGALIGAVIAPFVLWWMPRQATLRATRDLARPVTPWRRWLGMAIDLALFNFIGFALIVSYRLILLTFRGELPETPGVVEAALGSLVPGVLVFLLPALQGSGASMGQRTVWLVPAWVDGATLGRRIARAAVGGVYSALQFISQLPLENSWGTFSGMLANVILVVAFLSIPLTHNNRGLSGVVAGADMVDERAQVSTRMPREA